MTDPKNATSKSEATDQTGTSGGFVAIGRLRRDTMILGAGTAAEMKALAKAAVLEGRAAEVYVIAVSGYFSESEVRWDDNLIDTALPARATTLAQPPLLNPSTGKQASGDDSKLKATTVAAERRKAEDASKTTADLVDGSDAQREAAKDEEADKK